MSHTVVGKLNGSASQFQAGDSTGFGIRVGEQYYDRETKQKEWTNYECVIFAKQPQQVQFYQQALVEGSIVKLTGEAIKIKTFDGQNGQKITLELTEAKLGNVYSGQAPQQNNGCAPQQQQQQQQTQQGGYAPQNQQHNQGGYQQQAPQQNNQAAPQQQGGFNPNQPNDIIPF